MKPNWILLAYLILVTGLLLTAALAGPTASLATGPPPTGTPPGAVKVPYIPPPGLVVRPPGHQVTASYMGLDRPSVPSPAVHPVALTSNGTGWQRIELQDFESTPFPDPPWRTYDLSDTDGGEYLWGQRSCPDRVLSGSYSVWAGGGGNAGGRLACGETYTNNLKTWLKYGPFDLSQATGAELQLSLWADVEGNGANIIDEFDWYASIPGSGYGGYATAGQTGDWVPESLDLTNVPTLGNLTGQPEVYAAWAFKSNRSNPTAYEGAFVDDAALWVYVPPLPTPPPPTPVLPITRHTSLADFVSGRSHDSTVVKVEQGDGALALAVRANTLGPWERLPSLPRELFYFGAVMAKGHLFIIGGNSPDGGHQSRVYSAPIQEDGLLGHWVELTKLPQALTCHAAVVANDHLFALGGYNLSGIQATVYSARISEDGTLGEWNPLPFLPEPLMMSSAISAHGYVYLLGGRTADDPATVSDTIYRAAVNADGTLSAWEKLSRSLPRPFQQHAAVVACNHLYLIGGNDELFEWNGVYQAEVHADGRLGDWSLTSLLPETLSHHAAVALPGGILVTGGWNSSDPVFNSQRRVYWAPLGPDCSLGSWVEVTPLPYGSSDHALAATARYIYNLGGTNAAPRYFAGVLMAPLQLDDSSVQQGTFNHQFRLGDNYTIESLRWTEEGNDDTTVSLRYRVGDADTGEYDSWSDDTSINPVPVNASGGYLEYQLQFEGGNGLSDKYVTEVSLSITPSLNSVYLPLVVKDY